MEGRRLATRAVQLRAGQAHARVSQLIARHERSLMRVAQHWSLCRDDALDAYQRALEIYLRRLDTLDPATEIAWMKVVKYRNLGTHGDAALGRLCSCVSDSGARWR